MVSSLTWMANLAAVRGNTGFAEPAATLRCIEDKACTGMVLGQRAAQAVHSR
ncbi:MAG: hypothetical protein Q6L50_01855 [Gloeomargarita sp. GMQP_bins_120]